MTIGERLTELRKSRGLSQEELAEQLTLTRQTISKWELGQSSPDIEYVIALCEYFGVSTDYLLKGEEPVSKAEKKEEETQPVILAVKEPEQTKKWMTLALGMILSSMSFLVIAYFAVASIVDHSEYIVQNLSGTKHYKGLRAYLLTHEGSRGWFIVAVVMLVIGLAISVYAVVRSRKSGKKEKTEE